MAVPVILVNGETGLPNDVTEFVDVGVFHMKIPCEAGEETWDKTSDGDGILMATKNTRIHKKELAYAVLLFVSSCVFRGDSGSQAT